jgi:hypothetical protein
VQNVQVTYDTSTSNARCESSIAINPNNPNQIVAASKKFANIQTYDFTLATEYSTDGGQTWHASPALALPEGATVMTDPTLAWDDSNNAFLVGLTGNNPPTWNTLGIVIYSSSDGGATWSKPNPIHNSPNDDKQWAAGDTGAQSPFRGHVYAVWDNGCIAFARTTDHGATWTGTSGAAAGVQIAPGSTVYPEITVSGNGTVYVVSTDTQSLVAMLTSTDGGASFQTAPNPATGITTLEAALPTVDGFPELPGGTFRVISDPTVAAYGDIVLVAWSDYREGAARIYYVRSADAGQTWSTPSGQRLDTATVPSDLHHIMPQMVVDQLGVFGCAYYEFGPKPSKPLIDVVLSLSDDQGLTFGRDVLTSQPWDPTIDAPWSHGDSRVTFIGDYLGLDASSQGFLPLWTDTRTGIQELFTTSVPADLGLCIVEVLNALEGGEIELVRQFRDRELSATSLGRRLTALVERHGDEIARCVATDRELHAQAASLLRRSVRLIESAGSAQPGRLDREFIGDVDGFLDRLRARASSGLRRDIDQARPDLRAAEGKTIIEALRE